jgi:hypothetical protein
MEARKYWIKISFKLICFSPLTTWIWRNPIQNGKKKKVNSQSKLFFESIEQKKSTQVVPT